MPDIKDPILLPFTEDNTIRTGGGALALMEDDDTSIRLYAVPVALAGAEDRVDLLRPSPRGPVNPAVVQVPGGTGFLAAAVDTRRSKLVVDTYPHTDHLIAASMALLLSETQAAESIPLDELVPVIEMLDEEMPEDEGSTSIEDAY